MEELKNTGATPIGLIDCTQNASKTDGGKTHFKMLTNIWTISFYLTLQTTPMGLQNFRASYLKIYSNRCHLCEKKASLLFIIKLKLSDVFERLKLFLNITAVSVLASRM